MEKEKQKVSVEEIKRLQQQKVQKNGPVDAIDSADRACGRIFSKLGKFIAENF